MRIVRLHITLLFLLVGKQVLAQSCAKAGEAIKAYQAKDMEAAKKAIDLAAADPACAADPTTWYYKAFLNKEYYRAKENTQKNSPSRNVAVTAAKKNLEMDPANKYAEECKKILNFLSVSYYNDAASDLNSQKYQAAHDNYVLCLETIKSNPSAKMDTSAIFYAGYTAFMANNFQKAKEYLTRAMDIKYNDPNVYYYLGKTHLALSEKDKAYKVLDAGIRLFPSNKELVLTQANLYIEDGKLNELEKILDKAIQLDPKNSDLKINLATVCEKIKEKDKTNEAKYSAKEERLYKEVITAEPSNFRANYNLGVMYYNRAIAIIDASDPDQTGIEELSKLQDKTNPIFLQAKPYFLKAYQIDPKKKEVLEGLAGIYFALNDIPKSNEFKQKADAIK
jgi:tetratricopeptide (TPR) repeat protein